jgi:hypothetical protein
LPLLGGRQSSAAEPGGLLSIPSWFSSKWLIFKRPFLAQFITTGKSASLDGNAEIVEQEQASSNLDPTGHGADTEAEKTEKEGNREENRRKFSETGVNAEHSNECYSSA